MFWESQRGKGNRQFKGMGLGNRKKGPCRKKGMESGDF